MSYRNAIRDIPPGSLWSADGLGQIRVLFAAAGHVSWRRAGGWDLPISTTSEGAFRAVFAPLYDRAKVRSQFCMSCANLGEFRVYWLPAHRTIMARSVSIRRRFTVPDDAVLVGVYSAPCPASHFLEDLDDVIAKVGSAVMHDAAAIDEIIVRGHGERERGRARA